LTNDIQALTAGAGCYAAWLTPQGRMLTDMHVLEAGDMILLDVPAAQAQPTLQRLDQFLFSEDVQLSDLDGALSAVWIHGPASAHKLETIVSGAGLSAWSEYRNQRFDFRGSAAVIAHISQLGVPGYCVYAESGQADALTAALASQGVVTASPEALEAARIEAGYPLFGVDMTDDTIPLEAGIEDRAISFTKGCYVGQEVIIRVVHRGHGRVARRLVGLRIQGSVPDAGSRIYVNAREIGFITSAADSPTLGSIALGYIHRDFVTPETKVQVQTGAARSDALVTPRPMPAAM
jgi:folate-binding protein YgfZ